MKSLILILLISSTVQSQRCYEEKTYQDSTGNYVVTYNYEPDWCNASSVRGEERIFKAKIVVYKLTLIRCICKYPYRRFYLATLSGKFMRESCFPDRPEFWVHEALKKNINKE